MLEYYYYEVFDKIYNYGVFDEIYYYYYGVSDKMSIVIMELVIK